MRVLIISPEYGDVCGGAGIALSEYAQAQDNVEILSPVIWSDNYISILPGERRSIEGLYQIRIENFEIPDLKIRGWNLEE